MHLTFDTDHDRQMYADGFQHAMQYACDCWELLQHRGKGTVDQRRAALRHFARALLAQPVAGDSYALSIPHLEHYEIGYDRQGVFYARPKK